MVTAYDVQAQELIIEVARALKNEITMPEWALFVKTGSHKERPPHEEDWWYIRAGALLRTIYMKGPVGVQKLRKKYGGRKVRGTRPEQFRKSSGKIIRVILQQLREKGLIEPSKSKVKKGQVITKKGHAFLDKIAFTLSSGLKQSPKNEKESQKDDKIEIKQKPEQSDLKENKEVAGEKKENEKTE